MSGIQIEASISDASVEKSLANINKQLAELVKTSHTLNKTVGKADFSSFKVVSFQAKAASAAFTSLRFSATSAAFAITLPFKAASAAIAGVGTAARTAAMPLNSLVRTLAGLPTNFTAIATAISAIAATKVFLDLADEATAYANKLRLVTKTTDDLIHTQTLLYKISQETYNANSATVGAYFNLARSMRDSTQSELLALTKTIQQTAAMSGGSVQAISAGLTQLNQGLASGVLRGDEFNSVLENIPRLAQAIYEGLGLTLGQLRALAETGELTGAKIARALTNQSQIISKEFASMTMLASQGIQNLQQAIKKFFQVVGGAVGVNPLVGKTLASFAKRIDEVSARVPGNLYAVAQAYRNTISELKTQNLDVLSKKFRPDEWFAGFRLTEDADEEFKEIRSRFLSMNKVAVLKPKVDRDEIKRSLSELYVDAARLANNVYSVFEAAGSKLKLVMPDIRGPSTTLFTDILAQSKLAGTELKSKLRSVLGVDLLHEGFDNEIEKAVVHLLESKSLSELATNMRTLAGATAEVNQSGNFFSIMWRDATTSMASASETTKTMLRYVGLLGPRLFFVNNIRFDRLSDAFRILQSTIQAVYDFIIYPKFAPQLRKIKTEVFSFSRDLKKATEANLTFEIGVNTGKGLVNSTVETFKEFKSRLTEYFQDFDLDAALNVDSTVSNFVSAFVSIGKFIVGVLKGIGAEVGKLLFEGFKSGWNNVISFFENSGSDIAKALKLSVKKAFSELSSSSFSLEDTFSGLKTNSLSKPLQSIKNFAKDVKTQFYDIYDKVVGHSYWPDMIDGVVNYTNHLFDSRNKVEKFADTIKGTFSNLSRRVAFEFDKFTKVVSDLSTEIGKKMAAVFTAALMVAFGGNKLKAFGIGYLIHQVRDMMGPALDTIMIEMAKIVAVGLAEMVSALVKGVLSGIDRAIERAPVFLENLLASFGGIGVALSKAISIGFDNKAIYAALMGIGIYASRTQDRLATLRKIFIGMPAEPGKDGKEGKPKSNGVVDYVKAILNKPGKAVSTSTEGKPAMYKAILGDNPALLAAGIGVASTAFFKSVTAMEAISAATPLLAFAIFGKDAGGRMIRDSIRATFDLLQTFAMFAMKTVLSSPISTFLVVNAAFAELFRSLSSSIDGLTSLLLGLPFALASRPLLKTGYKLGKSLISGAVKAFDDTASARFAVSRLFENLGQAVKNAQRNAEAYASGTMSLKEMFLKGTNITESDTLPLKRSWMRVYDMVMDAPLSRGAKPATMRQGAEAAKSWFEGVKQGAITHSTNILSWMEGIWSKRTEIGKSVLDFLAPFGAAIANLFRTMAAGARLLWSAIISPAGVFVGLAVAVGAATAATGDLNKGLADTESFLETVSKRILEIGAGLFALGKLKTLFDAFMEGRSVAINKKKDTTAYTQNAAKAAFDEIIGGDRRPSAEKLAKATAAAKAARDAARENLDKVPGMRDGATAAGFQAMFAAMGDMGRRAVEIAKNFGSNLKTGIQKATSAFDKKPTQNSKGQLLIEGPASGFKKTLESLQVALLAFERQVIALSKTVWAALVAIFSGKAILQFATWLRESIALVMAYRTSIGTLAAIKNVLPAAVGSLMTGLAAVGGAITGLIGGTAALAGGVALVTGGVLGLALFGPGDSLMESLEYIKDKVFSIFDAAPTSGVARFNDTVAKLKDVKIDGVNASFRKELEKVNFSDMSSKTYASLTRTADATSGLIARMEEAYDLQGRLTAEQIAELEKGIARQKEVLATQTRKAPETIGGQTNALISELVRLDNSFLAKLERLFVKGFARDQKPTGKPLVEDKSTASKVSNYFTRELDSRAKLQKNIAAMGSSVVNYALTGLNNVVEGYGLLFDEINDALTDKGSKRLRVLISKIRQSDTELQPFESSISEADKELYSAAKRRALLKRVAADEYRERSDKFEMVNDPALSKLDVARGVKKTVKSEEAYQKRLEQLEKEADTEELWFSRIQAQVRKNQQEALSSKAYKELKTTLAEGLKKNFGQDFGENFRDFYGSQTDLVKLSNLTKIGSGLQKQIEDAKDPEIEYKLRIDFENVARQIASIVEAAKSNKDLNSLFEYQIKVSGINVDKEAILSAFENDSIAYDAWAKAVKELEEARLAVAAIGKDTDKKDVAARRERLRYARKRIAETAPGESLLSSVAGFAEKGNLFFDSRLVLAGSTDALNKIKLAFEAASAAKAELDQVPKSAPLSAHIAAAKKLRDRMAEAAAELASFNMFSLIGAKGSMAPKDYLELLQTMTNSQMPPKVGRDPKRSAAWQQNRSADLILQEYIKQNGSGWDAKQLQQYFGMVASVQKQKEQIEDVPADPTTAGILSGLSELKAPFTAKEFANLPANSEVAALIAAVKNIAVREEMKSKNELSRGELSKLEADKSKWSEVAQKLYREFRIFTPEQRLQQLAEAGFDLATTDIKKLLTDPRLFDVLAESSSLQQLRQSDNANVSEVISRDRALLETIQKLSSEFKLQTPELKLQGLTDLGFNLKELDSSRLLNDPRVAGLLARSETLKLKRQQPGADLSAVLSEEKDIAAEVSVLASSFGLLYSKLRLFENVAPGVELTADKLSKLGPDFEKAAEDFNRAEMALSTLSDTPLDRLLAKVYEAQKVSAKQRASRKLEEFDTTGEFLFKDLGVDFSNYKYLNDTGLAVVKNLRDSLAVAIEEHGKRVKDGQLIGAARLAAEANLDEMREALQAALAQHGMQMKDNPAYQAGQSYALDVKNAMAEGIKGVLKGKITFADGLKGVIDAVTGGIIDNFVNGFVDTLTGKKDGKDSLFGKLLSSIGMGQYQAGADAAGGNGLPSMKEKAERDLISALQQLEETFRSAFNLGPKSPSTQDVLANGLEDYGDVGDGRALEKDGVFGGWVANNTSLVSQGNKINAEGFSDMNKAFGMFGNSLVSLLGGAGGGQAGFWVNTALRAFSVFGGMSSASGGMTSGNTTFDGNGAWSPYSGAFASGGVIPGNFGSPVPILAHGGEVILNPEQQRALILGGDLSGGRRQSQQQVFNINITGDISRQTRSEIQNMIPQIASGVNAHNYEKGNNRRN